MTAVLPNVGTLLGERLFELGVYNEVIENALDVSLLLGGKAVLIVTDNRFPQWGIARADMPYAQFLREVLPDKPLWQPNSTTDP